MQFIKSRNDRIAVSDKFLPGRPESRVLIEFPGRDHVVDLLLEVSDLRNRVAELALIECQRNTVELTQQAGTIFQFGVFTRNRNNLNFVVELGDGCLCSTIGRGMSIFFLLMSS